MDTAVVMLKRMPALVVVLWGALLWILDEMAEA